jgi:hypothetical protein
MEMNPGMYGKFGWIETVFQICGILTVWIGVFITMGVLNTMFDGNEKFRLGAMIMVIILGVCYLGGLIYKILFDKEIFAIIIGVLNFITFVFWAIAMAYTGFASIVSIIAIAFFVMAQVAKMVNIQSGEWEPNAPLDKPKMTGLSIFMTLCLVVLWIMEVLTSAHFSSMQGWI